MRVALYKGRSLFSRAIRFSTWSEFSHVAWVDDDNSVIQAWRRGVTKDASLSAGHTPGTEVWLFRAPLATPRMVWKQREFLGREVGKPYDKAGILGFVRRMDVQRPDQWFCSEIVFAAFLYSGLPLLKRIPAHKVYPGLLAYSPLLDLETIVVTK